MLDSLGFTFKVNRGPSGTFKKRWDSGAMIGLSAQHSKGLVLRNSQRSSPKP